MGLQVVQEDSSWGSIYGVVSQEKASYHLLTPRMSFIAIKILTPSVFQDTGCSCYEIHDTAIKGDCRGLEEEQIMLQFNVFQLIDTLPYGSISKR